MSHVLVNKNQECSEYISGSILVGLVLVYSAYIGKIVCVANLLSSLYLQK